MRRCMVIGLVAILAVIFGASIGTSLAQNEKGDKGATTGKEELSGYEPAKSERINAFIVEKIVGSKVQNMKGEDLGTIEDIVVDIDRGTILYAVMDVGGFLGIGGKLFPVPWRSLAALPSEGVFFLDISKDKFKNAPAYDKNSLPDMGDMHWGTKLADFYEVPRSYRDYYDDYDFRSGFFYPSIAQQDPFAKTFDPESMKKLSGQVIKVEMVVPEHGNLSQMQVELIVLADSKEVIPVYVGPLWYVIGPHRRIPFKSGDEITATGSWITSKTEPFLIATSVAKGDQRLKLRKENGSPVWNAWEEISDEER